MTRPLCACLFATLLCAANLAGAGEFNEVLSVGDAAPAWSDLPGVDGKTHSLADLKEKRVVVVVFTCNSCPVAVDYENRIIALAKRHDVPDGPVGMVAINVNLIEADRLPKMKERAEAKAFLFPYLFDETQQIAKKYGAVFTPQFFVLDENRRIVYMGRMDDETNPEKAAQAGVNYVEDAIQAALKGAKPATAETLGVGCRIRFVSERRRPAAR